MNAAVMVDALLQTPSFSTALAHPSSAQCGNASAPPSLSGATYFSDAPTQLEWGLLLACGLFWTVAYLAIIATSHRTRTTGMPYFPLALNLTWELCFSFLTPHDWPQRGVDIVWLLLDAVILLQTLLYFPYTQLRLPYSLYLLGTGAVLATSLALNYAWSVTLRDIGAYSAFVSNALMSVAYVALFLQRRPRGAGQSLWIGVSKMLGTMCASGAWYLLSEEKDALLNVCFVLVFLWDAAYVGLLVHHALQPQQDGSEQLEAEREGSSWWKLRREEPRAVLLVSPALLTESSAMPSSQLRYTG